MAALETTMQTAPMIPAVTISDVDIIFAKPRERQMALDLLDQGRTREEILAATGSVLGAAGVNLTVAKGEICVLMGLSGSGKSTVLRAVNRLNPVTRGKIEIAHQGAAVDIAHCSEATLREIRQHRVTMVFQQFALLPWRTVRENVAFGLELRGMSRSEMRKVVDEKLEMVGLHKWADKYASELSGGMQQRVGLARAFATDADILLMDEPFSALDPLIRTKLQDELLELQARLHKTIIFVSHDLDEALKIGDHIAIMEGGRISQYGTPEEIVLTPANPYVREFVANVNPMTVLTAYNVMRDVRDLEQAGDGWVWLDRRKTTRFQVGTDGKVTACERDGQPAKWLACEDVEISGIPDDHHVVFWARVNASLRPVMLAMHRDAAPVGVFDAQDRFVGAIGVRDVLQAVLHK
jgi:glycine betaine/proline transport system ATP-binding protein